MLISHGIYDTATFGVGRSAGPALHPLVEAALLDPASWIWQPSNPYLLLFPEELQRCLGTRLHAVYTPDTVPEQRSQAQRELKALRQCLRRYHARPRRLAGRPSKLTPVEREQMSTQHDGLRDLMRRHAGSESPPPQRLDEIFHVADFVKELLERFAPSKRTPITPWETLLESMRMIPLSERALRYLAFQHGVSKDTIKRAIWPRGKPQQD